jgi:hypothetical protein
MHCQHRWRVLTSLLGKGHVGPTLQSHRAVHGMQLSNTQARCTSSLANHPSAQMAAWASRRWSWRGWGLQHPKGRWGELQPGGAALAATMPKRALTHAAEPAGQACHTAACLRLGTCLLTVRAARAHVCSAPSALVPVMRPRGCSCEGRPTGGGGGVGGPPASGRSRGGGGIAHVTQAHGHTTAGGQARLGRVSMGWIGSTGWTLQHGRLCRQRSRAHPSYSASLAAPTPARSMALCIKPTFMGSSGPPESSWPPTMPCSRQETNVGGGYDAVGKPAFLQLTQPEVTPADQMG